MLVFEEELKNRSEVDGKKRGDDLDHRDHRHSAVEGGWDEGVQEVVKVFKTISLSTAKPSEF